MPYKIEACAGQPYRPSNGRQGARFMAAFCEHCAHENYCQIWPSAMVLDIGEEGYPPEWTHDSEGRPTCTAFERHTHRMVREQTPFARARKAAYGRASTPTEDLGDGTGPDRERSNRNATEHADEPD